MPAGGQGSVAAPPEDHPGMLPHGETPRIRVGRRAAFLHDLRRFTAVVARKFANDDCPLTAAAIAYYGLLSIFPFLLAVTTISTHFLEQERVRTAIQDVLRTYLPVRARTVVLENMEEAIRLRGPVGAAAIVTFLWSSAAAVGTIRHSLNRMWDVKRSRPFWRRKLLEVTATLVLGSVLGALVAASVGVSILTELGWKIPFSESPARIPLADVLREVSLIGLLFVTFILIYKLLPNRRLPWRWLWPGALAAAAALEGVRHLAFWVLATFAQYQLVYGSMAGIIVFVLWMYVVALILLLGAEISRCLAISP